MKDMLGRPGAVTVEEAVRAVEDGFTMPVAGHETMPILDALRRVRGLRAMERQPPRRGAGIRRPAR